MEMEDQQQERKFECKWCLKCYPCGKSLGGHIKAHRMHNSVGNASSFDVVKKSSYNVGSSHVEIGGNSSYSLRENRRMSLKAVELIDDDDEGFPLFEGHHVCKHCGKGFQSLKSLSGHMACHSEKDRGFKDDDYSDTLSDTESEEMKVKNKRRVNGGGALFKSFSSSVSDETDDLDHEEVAMCLMMLSKDSSNWGGVNSVVESSDNQSDVLETKSSSIETKTTRNHPVPEANKAEVYEQESSDSGYYLDECVEKGESDTSFDGFFKNAVTYEAKNNNKWPNVIEPTKNNKKMPKRHAAKEVDLKRALKKTKYECMNCKKTFSSYQGLGGHRPCTKKPNSCYEKEVYENGENNSPEEADATDSDESKIRECLSKKKQVEKKPFTSISPKKNKIHECPFCKRVFKNGQALGGHKRSHFLNSGGSGSGGGGFQVEATNRARVMMKSTTQSELLDLNLPAPTEEDEATDDDNDDDTDDGDDDFVRDTRFLASIDE